MQLFRPSFKGMARYNQARLAGKATEIIKFLMGEYSKLHKQQQDVENKAKQLSTEQKAAYEQAQKNLATIKNATCASALQAIAVMTENSKL